jgi:Flp pilus assembly protein TadG
MLLILLFAIVDMGRAFYTWNQVANAAREGARTAAVQSDTATINAAVTSAMGSLTTTSPTLTRTYTNVQAAKGNTVTVKLDYKFKYVTPLSPLLQLVGGSAIANPTLSSTSAMRLE